MGLATGLGVATNDCTLPNLAQPLPTYFELGFVVVTTICDGIWLCAHKSCITATSFGGGASLNL